MDWETYYRLACGRVRRTRSRTGSRSTAIRSWRRRSCSTSP
ncbi:hypothetical protein NKH18_25395 [Streptomyces sp. M10(2022)]